MKKIVKEFKNTAHNVPDKLAHTDEEGKIIIDISFLGNNPNIIIKGLQNAASVEIVDPILTPANNSDNNLIAQINQIAYKIGDILPDGWIVGPPSPTTGKPFAIEPPSIALKESQTWEIGQNHAKILLEQGYKNARQPDTDELKAIQRHIVMTKQNHNSQLDEKAYYWSSEQDKMIYTRAQIVNMDGSVLTTFKQDKKNIHAITIRDQDDITLCYN